MAANRTAAKSAAAFRTISEVSDDLQVPQHVLRFWETKFSQVRPMKRGGGRRYYRPEDIELLRQIRDLLYSDGYTIKGVQKLLREGQVKPPAAEEAIEAKEREGAPSPANGSRLAEAEASKPGQGATAHPADKAASAGATTAGSTASGATTGRAPAGAAARQAPAGTPADPPAAAKPGLDAEGRRELRAILEELEAARAALRAAGGD